MRLFASRALLPSNLLTAGLLGVSLAAQATKQPAQPTAQPTRAAIEAVLADLDERFARGDVAGYLSRFVPDHQGAHAMLELHLRRQLALGTGPSCKSRLLDTPRTIGPRVVADVEHVITFRDERLRGDFELVEHAVLALRIDNTDPNVTPSAVPTFTATLPNAADHQQGRDGKGRKHQPTADSFGCPPCNYSIGGAAGWICVPIAGDRTQALEGASFYRLGSDLTCDISVRVTCAATTAMATVRTLADDVHQLDPAARAGLAVDWLPPAHVTPPVRGLSGAKVDVTLGDGDLLRLHVAQFGGLQHVLLARGGPAAFAQHAAALQALLDSYRLITTDCDFAETAATALRHHTGGVLEDERYRNVQFDIALQGPQGWRAEQRSGGAAFRVVWTSTLGSRLWLIGYAVPRGMPGWCTNTADRWLNRLCEDTGLQLPAPQAAAWQDFAAFAPRTARTALLRCVPKSVGDPTRPQERWLRVVVCDDLLVVLDAHPGATEDLPALRAALERLERNR